MCIQYGQTQCRHQIIYCANVLRVYLYSKFYCVNVMTMQFYTQQVVKNGDI